MTRVSIIVPCYNAHEFLEEAVASALGQTHDDTEVIIVDDGSTDERTLSMLRHPPWHGVRLLRQENRGLAGARNAGIAAATGDYILPLDSDDLIAPTYVARAVEVLDTRADVGIVYCRARRIGAFDDIWPLPDFSVGRMLVQNVIFASALFRRSAWEGLQGYREDLRVREDHHFWLGILATGASAHRLDEVLFTCRVRPDSMNATASREDLVTAHTRMVEDYCDLYASNARAAVTQAFDLVDELNDWRGRYGAVDATLLRHPTLHDVLRAARRTVRRPRKRS